MIQMITLRVFVFSFLALTIYSCGNNKDGRPDQEELKSKIENIEDSLKKLQTEESAYNQIPKSARIEQVNRLLDFYHNYPEEPFAAECLDKVHMVYSGMNDYYMAAKYADTLLNKFPDYPNRAMILESQASNYDIFIEPRDSAKVRYYYEILLKEYPKLEKEKRNDIRKRLKYNDLTFNEYLLQNRSETANK